MIPRYVLLFIYALLSISAAQATITDQHGLLNAQEIETLENKKFDLYQSHKIHTQIHTYENEQQKKQALQAWRKRRSNKSRASILILTHTKKANGFSLYFEKGITKINPDLAAKALNKSAVRINHTTPTTFNALLKFLDTIPDNLSFLKGNAATQANDLETEINYQESKSDKKSSLAIIIALSLLGLFLLIGLAYLLLNWLKKKRPYEFPLIHHQPRLGGNLAGGTSALITKDKARIR